MGVLPSKILFEQRPPEELNEFKKLAIAPEEYCIPEIPEKRQVTDKYFLYVYGVVTVVLLIFIGYTLYHRDLRRYTNGYDMCGNICGVKNEYVEGIDCSGKDMREFKYLLYETYVPSNITFVRRHCTKECDSTSHVILNNQCIPDYYSNAIIYSNNPPWSEPILGQYDDIYGALDNTIQVMLIEIGLCLLMLVLFRYATAIGFWFIVVGCYLFTVIVMLVKWYSLFVYNQKGARTSTMAWTSFVSLTTIRMIRIVKRIPLVIRIYKEAMRAIWAMPQIIFLNLLTFLSIFIALLVCLIVTFSMLLCGVLVHVDGDFYVYQLNNTMMFTIIFNMIFTLWMIKLILGCQMMVVSGSISTWYFSRDKSFMGSPINDSLKNLIKFHLGSVILGSLILTPGAIFKALVWPFTIKVKGKAMCSCCLSIMERFLVYITQNAYIMIAMHGADFFKSGKRAVKLIYLNLNDVIELKSIGDFVLFMVKLFIVIFTLVLSIWIQEDTIKNVWVVILVEVIMGILLAHSIFKIMEIAIDTIFLCYCEDCSINNGIDSPYYMSAELMQFFEDSRVVFAVN